MRALYNNYVADSTLTATSENTSYPLENLHHIFLEKKFMALGSGTSITVLFPEDRVVSMIALGFQNLTSSNTVYKLTKGATETKKLTKGATETKILQASSTYTVKNLAGATLTTGELDTGNDTEINYIDPVLARSVEFNIASATGEMLYIGGMGIGNPLDIKLIDVDPVMSVKTRNTIVVTDSGQSLTKYRKALENFNIKLRSKTNDERKEIVTMAKTLRSPVFIDLFPLSHDLYRPYYAEFTDIGKIKRESEIDRFATGLAVEERR